MSALLDSVRERIAAVRAGGGLPGGAAQAPERLQALDEFLARGLPTGRDENWKYTSVARLAERAWSVATPHVDRAQLDALLAQATIEGLDAHRVLFVNGYHYPYPAWEQAAASTAPLPAEFVRILSAESPRDPLADRQAPAASSAKPRRFALLNRALFTGGAWLQVPERYAGKPVYLLFLTLTDDAPTLICPRVHVEAATGARVEIIEQFAGDGGTAWTNHVTTITAGAGSRITHYRVQEQAATQLHLAGLDIAIDADAAVASYNLDLGGDWVRNDVAVQLRQPGGAVTLCGLYSTRNAQHVDNHLHITHDAPRTRSEQAYRGVLQDRSRAVFSGAVLVSPGAQQIVAHQANNNLLLGEGCEVDSKPQLEIYADDVQCTHGATVGQIDDAALFYLRSRGVDENTARGMLCWAFASEIVAKVPDPALRAHWMRRTLDGLPDRARLAETLP